MRRQGSDSVMESLQPAEEFENQSKLSVLCKSLSMKDKCFTHEALEPGNSSVSECGIYSPTPVSPIALSPWNNINNSVCSSPDLMLDSQQNRAIIKYKWISSMFRHGGNVFSIAVGNGLLYTGSESKNIRAWTYPVLNEYSRFKSGSGSVRAVLVAQEKIFGAHNDLKIRVWCRSRSNPTVHKRHATLPTFRDSLHSYLKLTNYVPGNKQQKPTGRHHLNVISSLAYDVARDILYSGSWDKTVKVWRMSDLKCVETVLAHDQAVDALAVTPDGLLYSGSDDCTVRMWGSGLCLGGRTRLVLMRGFQVGDSAVKAVALSADGCSLYAGSTNGCITVWDKEKGKAQVMQHSCVLRGHRHAVLCLSAVDNLLFSGSADGTIRVWMKPALSCLAVLQSLGDPVRCIAATREDAHKCLVFSGSHDGVVMVWRVRINMVAPLDEAHDYFRLYKS